MADIGSANPNGSMIEIDGPVNGAASELDQMREACESILSVTASLGACWQRPDTSAQDGHLPAGDQRAAANDGTEHMLMVNCQPPDEPLLRQANGMDLALAQFEPDMHMQHNGELGRSPLPLGCSTNTNTNTLAPICSGCGRPIVDQYILRVDVKAAGAEPGGSTQAASYWHDECARCCQCFEKLYNACFEHDGALYCYEHYYRIFSGHKCGGCGLGIAPNELVYRHRPDAVAYHVACHRCQHCDRPLKPGDQIVFDHAANIIACVDHYGERAAEAKAAAAAAAQQAAQHMSAGMSMGVKQEARLQPTASAQQHRHGGNNSDSVAMDDSVIFDGHGNSANPGPSFGNDAGMMPDQHRASSATGGMDDAFSLDLKIPIGTSMTSQSDQGPCSPICDQSFYSSSCYDDLSSLAAAQRYLKRRGPRTTIKQSQLDVLNRIFNSTPKPSKHARAKLALETGLSMRVIQVWFQNRRSKERRLKHLCNWIRENENRGLVVPPLSNGTQQQQQQTHHQQSNGCGMPLAGNLPSCTEQHMAGTSADGRSATPQLHYETLPYVSPMGTAEGRAPTVAPSTVSSSIIAWDDISDAALSDD